MLDYFKKDALGIKILFNINLFYYNYYLLKLNKKNNRIKLIINTTYKNNLLFL